MEPLTNEQFEAKLKELGIYKVEGLVYGQWIDGKCDGPDNWEALNAAFNPPKPQTSEVH